MDGGPLYTVVVSHVASGKVLGTDPTTKEQAIKTIEDLSSEFGSFIRCRLVMV